MQRLIYVSSKGVMEFSTGLELLRGATARGTMRTTITGGCCSDDACSASQSDLMMGVRAAPTDDAWSVSKWLGRITQSHARRADE